MKLPKVFNHSIFVILMLVLACFMIVILLSMFNLPDIPSIQNDEIPNIIKGPLYNDIKLGKFGEMMLEMLPNDLAFTVFIPSEEAFEYYLKLRENDKYDPQEWNNVYATVSHVLGFAAVPRKIYAGLINDGEEVSFDSVSGFTLYVSKDFDGGLVVNRVRAKRVDVMKGDELVVHIMDGVIMDAEFEQSIRPDDDGDGNTMQV